MTPDLERITIQGPQGALALLSRRPAGTPSGPPIVLVHADAGRAGQWEPVTRLLADDRALLAPDLRGHGDSEPARDSDYGYAGRAADVRAAIEWLGEGAAIVVAHSGGGAVALRLAAESPALVAGVLLVDPPADPRALPAAVRASMAREAAGPGGLAALREFYATIAGPDAVVRERVLSDAAAAHPDSRAGVTAALAAWDPDAALAGVRTPLHVLASAAGETPHSLHRLHPGLSHETVDGTGHWVQLDRPDVVAAAVRRFAARRDVAGPAR